MASDLYEHFKWHPRITEKFKNFCKNCKHHSFISDSEEIVAYHSCAILNYPIWIDTNYPSNDDSINEEECPMYLEYTLGMKNDSE